MALATNFLGLLCTAIAHAWLITINSISSPCRITQQDASLLNSTTDLTPYSIPAKSSNVVLRAADIATKRTLFLYGSGVDFGGPSSPTGVLGLSYITVDSALVDSEALAQDTITRIDSAVASTDSDQYNGLKTVQDYTKLYERRWQSSSAPTGIDPGMLTNYTQDLLFSMEQLSVVPYAVRRLHVDQDSLPFVVDDSTMLNITGQSLQKLFSSGRLFYVDFRAQGQLNRTSDKYAPACDAYFYISSNSGDFLPLAIRTNVNNSLIYTSADSPNDWLLARMMFNTNGLLFAQFHHLANTHYVTEVVYQAAVRTLSDAHPVLGILARIMYGAFGIRPLARTVLFPPGGAVDTYFGYTGRAVKQYTDDLYYSGYAGAFQGNYLLTNLQRRGLINAEHGPALKSFPFYEDARPIYDSIRAFMATVVSTYYASSTDILADHELQAWLAEANGPAQAIDFPTRLTTPDQLVDILTHMAHLVSSSHHAVNTNQLITGAGVLPIHPTALYQSLPSSKGVTDVAPYLPPLQKALGFIELAANFARPLLAGTNRTLVHMFDDSLMLSRMPPAVSVANQKFMAAMQARSAVVKNRTFDASGLSQGMPFVWRALDPDVAPWSMTV